MMDEIFNYSNEPQPYPVWVIPAILLGVAFYLGAGMYLFETLYEIYIKEKIKENKKPKKETIYDTEVNNEG